MHMPKDVQPISFPLVDAQVGDPEDLVYDPQPEPDDIPHKDAYSEEDELWAQLEDISLTDEDLDAVDQARDGLKASQLEDEESYWSYFEDISLLLDGLLP